MKTPAHRKAGGPMAVGGSHLTPQEPATAQSAPKGKRERLAAITAVITARLEPTNPGQFTDEGVPQISAIESFLGWRPSSDERDTAWAAIQSA